MTTVDAIFTGFGLRQGDSVWEAFSKEVWQNTRSRFEALRRLLRPLYNVMKQWRGYLIQTWLPENHTWGKAGERYIRNGTGITLCVDHLPKSQLPRSLSAFLLQGREATFIHRLTVRSEEYDFRPIANEHDGLVTLGSIPDEAIAATKRASDIDDIRLVKKDFV